jgi:hypothetical protein
VLLWLSQLFNRLLPTFSSLFSLPLHLLNDGFFYVDCLLELLDLVFIIFIAPVQIVAGTHPASYIMGTGSFPGLESGRGVTLTPHPLLVPRSKNRLELYLYSPWGPSWPVKRAKPIPILDPTQYAGCLIQKLGQVPKQLHTQWMTGALSLGVRQVGLWTWPLTHICAEGKSKQNYSSASHTPSCRPKALPAVTKF